MNNASGTESRGTVMGIYGTVFSIGIVAGPVLLEFTGTQGAEPFVVGAGCLILTLLPLAVLRQVSERGAGVHAAAGTVGRAAQPRPS